MTKLRTLAIAAGMFAPVLFAGSMAEAAIVAGTSGGAFSNLSGCTYGETCRISDTQANGQNTMVEWGYQGGWFPSAGSTLTAVDRTWNVATDANDVILAELVWTNRATSSSITPDDFNVKYTLSINFTQPNAAGDVEAFSLEILNSINPPGDKLFGLTLADLSNLSFNLNGILVSDLKYSLAGGDPGSLNGQAWFNPEGKTSKMYITADFKAVPEPATLALLGAGIAGFGAVRRRKAAA
ncbi:choice-of-anchor K domain-containing protein [Arenibaculum pallidiluteum]|uniref:choice-of-anchor K domain-containing protein n=1 Tax=Arenibaculum pallidiluteum TaxID=2812559 RepID=UPI001A95FD49|nr:choice-of-anchor K domain-containing protein [Arenibaculum pallidiluteum]